MNKISKIAGLFVLIIFGINACSPTEQILPFSVLLDGIAFKLMEIERESTPHFPNLMIIQNQGAIESLTSYGFEINEETNQILTNIDYNQYVAIFVKRGHIEGSGVVREVIRSGNQVIIQTEDIAVRPGEYVLADYSSPYQLISVEKVGDWNRNIQFILERENGRIVNRVNAFVP
jgi:hypothetical protein